MHQPRSKGRPVKSLVDAQKIETAALEIIAKDGYSALTMSAIARRLGVGTSALYNHVAGKQGLLTMVEDAVMAQIDTSTLCAYVAGEGPDLATAMRHWAYSYREVFSRHSPLIAEIAVMPIFGTRDTAEMYNVLVQALEKAGVPSGDTMDIIVAFESFIYGSAFDVAAPEDIFAVPESEAEQKDDELSALKGALAARQPERSAGNPYADTPFEMGLRALMSALLPS